MNLPIKPPTVTPVELTVLRIAGNWWTNENGSQCSCDFKASIVIFKNLQTGKLTGLWRNRRNPAVLWFEQAQSTVEDISFESDRISFTVPGRMDERPTYTLIRDKVTWNKWHVTMTGTKYGDIVGTLPIRQSDGEAVMLGSRKKHFVQRYRSRLMSVSSFDDAKLLVEITGLKLDDVLAAYGISHPNDAALVKELDSDGLTRDKLTEIIRKHPPQGPLARHRLIRICAELIIADDSVEPDHIPGKTPKRRGSR